MKKVFYILLNLMIFYFVIGILGSAFIITDGDTVVNRLIVGLIFAILMAYVPNVLKFFKIQVNFASMLLVALLLSFLFFFISLYVLGIIALNSATIDIGLPFTTPIELKDRVIALLALSVISSLFSVGMEELSSRR